MLIERPQEQLTLFKEIVERRLTVRDSEALARRVAVERVRHKALISPDLLNLEQQLSERLGTRVRIEKKDTGGKVMIDFFSPEDLTALCLALTKESAKETAAQPKEAVSMDLTAKEDPQDEQPRPSDVTGKESDDLYSIRDFTL